MDILIVIGVYLMIGIVASVLYRKRDISNSLLVGLKVRQYVTKQRHLAMEDQYGLYCNMITAVIEHAGWAYWRRKPPFANMPSRTKNIIAFPFWVIDILLCEIGHALEMQYIEEHMEKGE